MTGVNPYIAFKGTCREAIEFYKAALNAEVLFMQTVGESPVTDIGPAENIMHATLKIGESTVMVCDDPNPEPAAAQGNISLAITVSGPAEANKVFASLAAGGTVIMPVQKTFWAEAFGMLNDKFGVKWMINCDIPNT